MSASPSVPMETSGTPGESPGPPPAARAKPGEIEEAPEGALTPPRKPRPHSNWAIASSRESKVYMEPKISAYRSVEPIFRALVLVPVRQHTR